MKGLDTGCNLSSVPVDEGGQHRRNIGYLAVPDLPIVYPCFAHHDCTHNQLVSIRGRVCGETKYQPNPVQMARLNKYMRRLGRSMKRVGHWDLDDVVQHYHGTKRARYGKAADKYRANGLTKDDAAVEMFIKCEKIKFSPSKQNPDPRAIQFRDPVYSVVLATYLKPIEEVVYQMRGNRLNGLPSTRVIGKGLNQGQRATLLRKKWDSFVRPVCLSLDASRFDQHVSYAHLQAEHALYLQLNNDPEFARLLSWQLVNRVKTTRGIRYKTRGKRMSGDMNTALGNCVIMVSQLGLYFEDRDIKWDCLDDGDDILVIVEAEYAQLLRDELPGHFAELGMDLKVENDTTVFEQIEWCQCRPVAVDGGWTLIRSPAKVLSGALVGPKWVQMKSESSRRALANTIGLCEAILNRGIPVLSAFAESIIRNARTSRQVRVDQADQLIYRVRRELGKSWMSSIPAVTTTPISDETRLSFSRAFDVSVDDQMHWEHYLSKWVINFDEPHLQPVPVNVTNWTWEAVDVERY
uniref:RNA-directed RNA polymerase n=1 Tax=Riboviria sp. TaxID=2585031 RepID=A0A514D0B9_9VIRU|nr:MAG: RNA-dependent RNA polymerase [Riboviria sp.]